MSADAWSNCPQCGGRETVREDYEQGILNGEYFVDFHAQCDCGFKFVFEHREKVVSAVAPVKPPHCPMCENNVPAGKVGDAIIHFDDKHGGRKCLAAQETQESPHE